MNRRALPVALVTAALIIASCALVARSTQHHSSFTVAAVAPAARVAHPDPDDLAPRPVSRPPTTASPLTAAERFATEVARMWPTTTTAPRPTNIAPSPARSNTAPRFVGPSVPITAGSVNGYPCGGDLPPCYVLQRESHGNPYAVNPGHRGAPYGDPGDPWTHASGMWQFEPGTWNHFGGYPFAAAAPASVQIEKAREVWANGAGCSNWSAC